MSVYLYLFIRLCHCLPLITRGVFSQTSRLEARLSDQLPASILIQARLRETSYGVFKGHTTTPWAFSALFAYLAEWQI